jgi:predicted small metal-binding protein
MAYVFYCRTLGQDCDYMTSGDSEDEVLARMADHARTAHGMAELSEKQIERARKAIVRERSYRYGPHSPV